MDVVLHSDCNFVETIDLSYISLQIKQSGFHGMNSQPSDKCAAPDKVCSLKILIFEVQTFMFQLFAM